MTMPPVPTPPVTIAAVIPSYNYADYIAEAIDSVLTQTPPFDEVVVVDDGSTDASVEVVRSYGDRVRLVEKPNGGQLSACLAGLAECSSDYVWFLDADDLAKDGLVAALLAVTDGRPAKVQFPLEAVDASREPTGSVFPTFPRGYDVGQMASDNRVLGFYTCPPTSGNVYRRDVLLGLDTAHLDGRDFIDGPPTLLLPHLGQAIVCIDRPLAQYRIHGANHSQWFRPTPERLEGEIEWFDRRWQQVCAVMGWDAPPFAGEAPAYVLERRLMIAALEGRLWLLPAASAFVRRSARAQLPTSHKVLLAAWTLLLLPPVARWRLRLVQSRRDPGERARLLRWVVAALRRSGTCGRAGGPWRPGVAAGVNNRNDSA